MAEALYHPRARRDLKEVFRHLALGNPDAAAGIVRLIGRKACLLATSPHLGQPAEGLAANLRRFNVGNYPIFYRPADGGVEVVRILHGPREADALDGLASDGLC